LTDEEFSVCFAELKVSEASESGDYDLYGFYCPKADLYMTFWDEPTDEQLKASCYSKCPFWKSDIGG
jgi:hypothetical protein